VEKANYPVTVLCHVLQVSSSGYYAWVGRPPSVRSKRLQQLAVKVRAAHGKSGGRYGSPRVLRVLRGQGEVVSEKTVAKVMRTEGIVGRKKRRYKVTTDSRNTERIADNLLNRDFRASAPDEVWVTDVTAIWSIAGWVYLAAILDLFSRRVVGWATSEHNDTDLALAALNRAIAARNPPPGLIHHSDRGSPYGSDAYHEALESRGFVPSMARKGDCWDNAVAESFFSTFKAECVDGKTYADYAAVTREAAGYIDRFYNPTRLHSTLDYVSPMQYELTHALHQEAA
jgi:transposase InsO family protein